MAPKKIIQRPDVRERNIKMLQNKVDHLAGQFAEVSLFVTKQIYKAGTESPVT